MTIYPNFTELCKGLLNYIYNCGEMRLNLRYFLMRGDKIFISGWSYIYTIDICMYDIIRYIYIFVFAAFGLC